jgi:capsular exopolysaccharide synthesis family protein
MGANTTTKSNDLRVQDITNILKKYKWFIALFTILAGLLSYAYLYFTPSMYNSYAIIKVKPNIKTQSGELINNTLSTTKSKEVTEEISLLQTYKINNQALSDIDLKVQYYIDEGYRTVEIYKELPVEVKDVNVLDPKVMGRKLTITPKDGGYLLEYFPSYKEKIEQAMFGSKLFTLSSTGLLPYGEEVTNEYLTLTVNQLTKIDKPIHFIVNGEQRQVFENIIKDRLEITQLQKDTSLIKINYQDTIPERAQRYVDALATSFVEYSIDSKNKQLNRTSDFIVEELDNIKKELKESEEQLENYQVSKSFVEPSAQATLYIQKLSDIEIQQSENNLKKKLVQNLISFVENNYNLDAIAPSLSKLDDQSTLALITKLQDNQLLEQELSAEYTNEYPKLKSVRDQIENIRNKIASNLKSLNRDIDYENKNLSQRKQSYESKMRVLPSKERQLVNIKRNYEVKSRMYEYLLKKKAESNIIQLATFSDYQIIDHAYNSNEPVNKMRSVILLLSIVLGFIVGSILALLRNQGNRMIQGKDDIEKLTSLPIYGTIPFSKQKKYQLEVQSQAKSPFAESFRTLRTNLQFSKKENVATTILITSTVAGEGKTTTTANLATMLEMAKYKTIVINLDLRKPTLHKFFSVDNSVGVSTYLDGKHNVQEVIRATEFANLDLITSGPIPADPSELILSKRLPDLFDSLKDMYDYIIIDSAPIGIVTDTKTIMKYTDLNLVILREDYAKKEFIGTLENMIAKYEFENIGLIINASKEQAGEYGYGYSYEYK